MAHLHRSTPFPHRDSCSSRNVEFSSVRGGTRYRAGTPRLEPALGCSLRVYSCSGPCYEPATTDCGFTSGALMTDGLEREQRSLLSVVTSPDPSDGAH